MRYVEAILRPKRGWFHPLDRLIGEHPAIENERILQIDLLEDGTVTTLYELTGDRETVDELSEHAPHLIASQMSPLEDRILVYAHIESNDLLTALLEIPRQYQVVFDPPIEYVERNVSRLTVVGSEEQLRAAMAAVPDEIQVTIDELGTYAPESERVLATLTDRQLEALEVAAKLGYYDEPRQATYEDIADALGTTTGSVGRLLRKAEARLIDRLL